MTTPKRLLPTDSAARKTYPMARGLLDYFPDACAAVAHHSWISNEKHNPGEEMHHARGKSTDHADCIMRHLSNHGGFDGETRESTALAWRAFALLQEELERDLGLTLPRGARGLPAMQQQDVSTGFAAFVPATRFGFAIGDKVNLKRSDKGSNPGTVAAFTDDKAKVEWREGGYDFVRPGELRHGE